MAAAPCVTRHKRVIIDSRERDHVAYPTPAEYELQLDDPVREVTAMRLVVADVPFPAHLIGARYTSLSLTTAATGTVVADMTVGDYANAADVATDLERALNAAVGQPAEFKVSSDARTGTLHVHGQNAFSFAARTRPLSRILGMPPPAPPIGAPPTSSPLPVTVASVLLPAPTDPTYPHLATTPFKLDMRGDRYIVMHVRTPDGEVLSSTRDAVNRGFAVIPVRRNQINVNHGDEPMEKTWEAPVARVSRLAVRFVDGEGNAYDFQNQDHRLEFLFITHTNAMMRRYA